MSNLSPSSRPWDLSRCVVLALALIGTGIVFTKAALTPPPQAATPNTPGTAPTPPQGNQQSFQFPTSIPITGWQLVDEQAVELKPLPGAPPVGSAYQYRYRQAEAKVQVQMWYVEEGEGNISRYLALFTPIRSTLGLKEIYQPTTGHAGLLSEARKLHLSSCINIRGESTLTQQQFTQNRYEHDLSPQRILGWVIGQNDLLDRRCLFTVVTLEPERQSTPLPPEAAQTLIEGFWQDWHQWWQPYINKSS